MYIVWFVCNATVLVSWLLTESRAILWELGERMGRLGRHVSFDGCFKHTLFARKGQGDLDALHINKQLWLPDSEIKAVENTKAFIKPDRLDDTCANDFRGDNKERPAVEYRNVSDEYSFHLLHVSTFLLQL
jgi:hypothetical protein